MAPRNRPQIDHTHTHTHTHTQARTALAGRAGPERLVGEARRVIAEEHGRTGLSLAFVAARVGVSKWALSRALGAARVKFWDLVRVCRMRTAGELIRRDPSKQIKEIAAAVGYAHETDFSAHFRRHWGVTPSAYRTAIAKQDHRPTRSPAA